MLKIILCLLLFSTFAYAQTNNIYLNLVDDKFVEWVPDEIECKKGIGSALSSISKGKLAYNFYGDFSGLEFKCIESYFIDSLDIDLEFVGCVVTPFDIGYNYTMQSEIKRIIGCSVNEYIEIRDFYCKTATGYRSSEYIGFKPALNKLLENRLSFIEGDFTFFLTCKIDSLGNVENIEIKRYWGEFTPEAENVVKGIFYKSKFHPALKGGREVESDYSFVYNYSTN